MKPRNESFEKRIFVGMKIDLPLEGTAEGRTAEIAPLWPKFTARLSDIPRVLGGQKYGIVVPGEEFVGYVAAVEVGSKSSLPAGMISIEFERGKFAVFTHPGALESIQDTYDVIFGEWLVDSGEELRDECLLETYRESAIDIAIPIE